MSTEPFNRQAGHELGSAQDPPGEAVATGDRREERRFEADPGQLVRVSHTFRPDGPLPPQERSAAAETGEGPPIEDVAVTPDGPSVWDARPAEDGDRDTR